MAPLQVTSVAGSSCKPVCEDRDRDLSNCKASCEEGRWDYTCVWNGCGTTIQAQAVDIIRTEACEYKEVTAALIWFRFVSFDCQDQSLCPNFVPRLHEFH